MNPLNSKIDLNKVFTTFKNTVMTKGMFILDINKNEVEVTDPIAAMKQCKEMVRNWDKVKALKDSGEDVTYIKDAHKDWAYKLRQLEQIERNHPNLFKS